MKKFEKILFIYSLVALTALLITFGLYAPNPQNLVSLLLLTPIALYFWLRLTSPQQVGVSNWSMRLLIIVVALSALGVYGGFLSNLVKTQNTDQNETATEQAEEKITKLEGELAKLKDENQNYKSIQTELESIKSDLARLSAEGKFTLGSSSSASLADLLSTLDNDSETGYVTIKNGLTQEIDVLEKPDFAASRVGTLIYGTKYLYSEKDGGWYKVELQDGKTYGWVHERDITIASN